MKNNKGLYLVIILAMLVLMGNLINRTRSYENEKPKEKVEDINPYSMRNGDDLLTRINILDGYAKEIDPDMTLIAIEWREDDRAYALLFRSEKADIIWRIDVT